MKEDDSKGTELQGLEQEIDQAIDSLFVEKHGGQKKEPPQTTGMAFSEPERSAELEEVSEESLSKEVGDFLSSLGAEKPIGNFLSETEKELEKAPVVAAGIPPDQPVETPMVDPIPEAQMIRATSPSKPEEILRGEADKPGRNLENLETHLLSLEWEISPDFVNKIVSELGFLKEAYQNDRAVYEVVDKMNKVAHAIAGDAGNITPENLRFLLEAKDGVKLLIEELKGKDNYRNVVLSGILAKYRLIEGQGLESKEKPTQPAKGHDFTNLTQNLQALSQKLETEIRQLGSIAEKLKTPAERPVPVETVGTVLMESAGRVFAINKDIVVSSLQIPYRMARTIWKDREIQIRGVRLPLINLFRLLKIRGGVRAGDKNVVLIRKGNRTLAIMVDRLLLKKAIPSRSIREEKRLAYIRGIVPTGHGRKIYFLDTDRMIVEF
jgi:chemotaxis protein histidine kinase CheA